MSWSRLDDLYDDHPKVKRAWRRDPAAVGLHVMAITYSSRHETDGYVDLDWLEEKMPNARAREKAVSTLVECGLFDPVDTQRFAVHDYLEFNPSAAQLQEKRRKDSERKANGRRKDSDGNPDGVRADISRNPDGPRGRGGAGPHPIPSQSQSKELQAATPQRSRADTTSRSRAETVACPRCKVPAGEKCDGVRAKRESAHLERHHAVGELLDRGGYDAAKPAGRVAASHTYRPDADMVAMRDAFFPGEEVGTLESAAFTLRSRRQEVSPESIAAFLAAARSAA